MARLIQPYALHLSALSTRVSPAPVVRLAVAAAFTLMKWDEAYRTRQQLKLLSAETLNDIGLTREDARREFKRPFFWD